jgi:hypothetical protein
MVKTVWLSYDLGVRGDYEGLFDFLAEVSAKECGSNLGVFSFSVQNDILKELKATIKEHMKTDKRSRIYVMYTKPDGKPTGRFIFGARKSPPWAGYGNLGEDEEDVSD